MRIILGSASKWRKLMLEKMSYQFEVMAADIDEKAIRCDDPFLLPQKIAEAKADVLMKKIEEPAILITADKVVLCNGELREKPADPEEAKRFLHSYNKYPAECINGIVVTNTGNGKRAVGVERGKIFFKPMPDDLIEKMSRHPDFLNAAGGFISEYEIMAPYVNKREGESGSEWGLPAELTKKLLRQVE